MLVSTLKLASAWKRIRRRSDFLRVHPNAPNELRTLDARAILDLPGEVLSGHADRHVAVVRIGHRSAILKREHRVPVMTRLRNWLAGFGFSSLAEREARVLTRLARAGVPVPQWLAYGESDGRAFVLLKKERGRDLAMILRQGNLTPRQRRTLAQSIGTALGRILRAGFTAPDLSAKHVLVRADRSIVLLDWPRAGRSGELTPAATAELCAGLHASLVGATLRERLLAFRACLRTVGMRRSFKTAARLIKRAAARRGKRRSIREQTLGAKARPSQRVRWVDGERLCVTRPFWKKVGGRLPGFVVRAAAVNSAQSPIEYVSGPMGRCWVRRFPAASLAQLLIAKLFRRPIRSEAIGQVGLNFRLARHGVPIAPVWAFGGNADGSGFIVTGVPDHQKSLRTWLAMEHPSRTRMLWRLGRVLQRCHAAGVHAIHAEQLTVIDEFQPRLHFAAHWLLAGSRATPNQSAAEIEALLRDLGLVRRRDIAIVLRGYVARQPLRRHHLKLAGELLGLAREAA